MAQPDFGFGINAVCVRERSTEICSLKTAPINRVRRVQKLCSVKRDGFDSFNFPVIGRCQKVHVNFVSTEGYCVLTDLRWSILKQLLALVILMERLRRHINRAGARIGWFYDCSETIRRAVVSWQCGLAPRGTRRKSRRG